MNNEFQFTDVLNGFAETTLAQWLDDCFFDLCVNVTFFHFPSGAENTTGAHETRRSGSSGPQRRYNSIMIPLWVLF